MSNCDVVKDSCCRYFRVGVAIALPALRICANHLEVRGHAKPGVGDWEGLPWSAGGIMNLKRGTSFAVITIAALALMVGAMPTASPAAAAKSRLQVTLGSSAGDIYEGSRLGLIARNAPKRATVTYEIWTGGAWRRAGSKRANAYGSALWSTKVPMGVSSLRVRVRAGKFTSRPLTVRVLASAGWQYWDQTHLGNGGLLKRLVTPSGSSIAVTSVHPLSGSYELLDAWGERVLVSKSNGSTESIYAWDPAMSEARYVKSVSAFDDEVSFGRNPDEILVRGLTYVGSGTSRSQFEDVTAYTLRGEPTELLARFPQDPYGTLSYIEVTSHVVDRSTGTLYFTRYWDSYPHNSSSAKDYAVTLLRTTGPPIDTSLSSDQMLIDGSWTERYGIRHRIPSTSDLVWDVQARSGTGGYLISGRNLSGGQVCTFSLSATADTAAKCVRVNSGEFIPEFALQNAKVGLVVEYVDSPRDFVVRRIDFSEGRDGGMEGRATAVAFGGR